MQGIRERRKNIRGKRRKLERKIKASKQGKDGTEDKLTNEQVY
jgi:fructose-specific phosphotransferase system component IIB